MIFSFSLYLALINSTIFANLRCRSTLDCKCQSYHCSSYAVDVCGTGYNSDLAIDDVELPIFSAVDHVAPPPRGLNSTTGFVSQISELIFRDKVISPSSHRPAGDSTVSVRAERSAVTVRLDGSLVAVKHRNGPCRAGRLNRKKTQIGCRSHSAALREDRAIFVVETGAHIHLKLIYIPLLQHTRQRIPEAAISLASHSVFNTYIRVHRSITRLIFSPALGTLKRTRKDFSTGAPAVHFGPSLPRILPFLNQSYPSTVEIPSIRTRHPDRHRTWQRIETANQSTPTMAAATAAAMIPDTFSVSVLVFKGDPIDWQRYRHTALCFRPASSSPSPPPTPSPRRQRRDSSTGNGASTQAPPPPLIIHAIGAPYEYEIQVIDDYEPRRDPERTLVQDIAVGKLHKAVTKEDLIGVVSKIPVDNTDSEFNCQTWVEKALKQLSDEGWVTEEEYNNGVDGMVEAIIEAEEEPE